MPTRILIAVNNIFQHYWVVLLIMVVLAAGAVFFLLRVKQIRLRYDKMKLNRYLL